MFWHQTLSGLPKYHPKNINEAPYAVFFTAKMTFLLKIQMLIPQILHQESFSTWNLPYIIWLLSEVSLKWVLCLCKDNNSLDVPYCIKQSPVVIVRLILTTLKNKTIHENVWELMKMVPRKNWQMLPTLLLVY